MTSGTHYNPSTPDDALARDLSMTISICSSMDGRVRLTTKHGATFDAVVVRHAFNPHTLVLEPIGFTIPFGAYIPDTIYVRPGNLRDAGRAEGPVDPPDVEVVRKACEWPIELPPKTTAAALKRAEQALADLAVDAVTAVRSAIETGATKGLAAAVARLDADTRRRLIERAVDLGADAPLRVLLDGAGVDLSMFLARAADKGKLGTVVALLDAGADPNAVAGTFATGTPRSILLHAVYGGHRAVVRQLLAAGARVDDGGALVWGVVHAPDAAIWSLLLAAGLDVNARDKNGDPVLLALGGHASMDLVATAVAAGADVNARYPDGSTLLLRAIDRAMHPSPCTTFVKVLLDAGADPNAGRLRGRNPLALARVVTHDPGLSRGERWIAGYLEAAGAVAEEDAAAPPIVTEPARLPAGLARIAPDLRRAASYTVSGVTFTPGPVSTALVTATFPRWNGLGADDIAEVRAKLEHLVGPPPSRGDEYKTTFEYTFVATIGEERLGVHICDWKAREVSLAVEAHPTLHERVAAAFIELLTIAPLASFRDRFRYDEDSGRAYHSDGKRAFAEFAKG